MVASVVVRAGPRQQKILRHLTLGRTDAQIASSLGISVATIRTYLVSLHRDNGSANGTEAMALWLAAQQAGVAGTRS